MNLAEFKQEIEQKIRRLREVQFAIGDMIVATETTPTQDRELNVILTRVAVFDGALVLILSALGRETSIVSILDPSAEEQRALQRILTALEEQQRRARNGRRALEIASNFLTAATILATEADSRLETARAPSV